MRLFLHRQNLHISAQPDLQLQQLEIIQKPLQMINLVAGLVNPINRTQQHQGVSFHLRAQSELVLPRKILRHRKNPQCQLVHISEHRQILIQHHPRIHQPIREIRGRPAGGPPKN
jgi:hypothetical protein